MQRTRWRAGSTGAAAALALAALLGVAAAGGEPPVPGRDERCAVCGMVVAPYAEWLARVVYADGTALFFDGPKDMFRYLGSPARYRPDREGKAVAAVLVTGYYDGAALPAKEALYVVGSDVRGPMGAELVPVRDRAEAEELRRDHGGSRILGYDEVTPEVVAALR